MCLILPWTHQFNACSTLELQNPCHIQAYVSTVKKPNVDLYVLIISFFCVYVIFKQTTTATSDANWELILVWRVLPVTDSLESFACWLLIPHRSFFSWWRHAYALLFSFRTRYACPRHNSVALLPQMTMLLLAVLSPISSRCGNTTSIQKHVETQHAITLKECQVFDSIPSGVSLGGLTTDASSNKGTLNFSRPC